jgi:zona occludens toxin
MLIFNEGLPRAGKSYDAVANHIIPALKSGRHVYARLNGLKPYAIAQTTGVPEDRVRQLLHVVDSKDVVDLFQIYTADDGTKSLNPALRRDSVFVIDEVHEFYPAARTELDPALEGFFAYHGQFGLDGVLISQWYKRVHDAIRGRVERKHLFRKLNFLKALQLRKKGDAPSYVCRAQIAMEPDKFAVLSSNTYRYDPAVWQCYTSYQGGAENVEAYDPGFTGIFSRNRKIAFALTIAVVVGGGLMLYNGYRERRATLEAEKVAKLEGIKAKRVAAAIEARRVRPVVEKLPPDSGRIAATATGVPLGSGAVVVPDKKHDARTGYFFNLAKTARTRLVAMVHGDRETYALFEWRIGNGNVLDRMDSRDLQKMGFTVELHGKWATLEADGETLVATMWPLDSPYSPPALNGEQAGSPATQPAGAGSSGYTAIGFDTPTAPAVSPAPVGESAPGV